LATPYGQSGGKIQLLKKIRPPTKFDFLQAFRLMKVLLNMCLGKVYYSFDFYRIGENKRRKTNFHGV
jgi:hypothetical protein